MIRAIAKYVDTARGSETDWETQTQFYYFLSDRWCSQALNQMTSYQLRIHRKECDGLTIFSAQMCRMYQQ